MRSVYYLLQAKSATKDHFLKIFLIFFVTLIWCMLPFDVWPSFPVTTCWSLVAILARQLYSRLNVVRLQFFFCNFFLIFNCRSLFNKATYLAALCRLRSPFAIRDANSKQSKTKIYEKTHLLLWILAVIDRYESHLMIVMIFVTQNNF